MNTNLLAIFPELLLLLLGITILIVDPFWKESDRRVNLGWMSAIGLIGIIILSLLFAKPGEPQSVLGGMVRYDSLGFVFKMMFIFTAGITSLFFMDTEKLATRAEAYLMLIAATIGMNFMASATDLVMIYLAIETTSIPMYVLSGFLLGDKKSTEAGFKSVRVRVLGTAC